MTDAEIAGWLLRIVEKRKTEDHNTLHRAQADLAGMRARQQTFLEERKNDPWDVGGFGQDYSREIASCEKTLDMAQDKVRWSDALYEFTISRIIGDVYNFCPNSGVRTERPPNS